MVSCVCVCVILFKLYVCIIVAGAAEVLPKYITLERFNTRFPDTVARRSPMKQQNEGGAFLRQRGGV
jgi:hypothetical protein